jgi:hypothetical protein
VLSEDHNSVEGIEDKKVIRFVSFGKEKVEFIKYILKLEHSITSNRCPSYDKRRFKDVYVWIIEEKPILAFLFFS